MRRAASLLRFAEAEAALGHDLGRDEVAANVASLRLMVAQLGDKRRLAALRG